MARMYPARASALANVKSQAERKLYELLRDGLPNDYVVFHSVAWLAREMSGRPGAALAIPAETFCWPWPAMTRHARRSSSVSALRGLWPAGWRIMTATGCVACWIGRQCLFRT